MSDVLIFDLAKDPKGNPIVYGRVGDSNGLTRKVKVFDDGKPFDLTGWTTTFEGNTSKYKTKVFDSEGITVDDPTKGEFSYVFPNMAFAVEGQYERAYFSFMKGDQRKSTGNFEIIVLGDSDIDAPEAETIITEYNKLVAELNELQKNNIADLQEQQDTYIQSTDKTFTAIQGRITNLQNTIKGFETSVNDTAADVLSTVNQALEELKAGNFYTQLEADARFAKTEDMSAHTENISNPHKVTKTQIGLGNVDNYSTATQAEAEAGTATNKFITPALVFKAIAKWVQGKFVSATGNETILGTKNFKDGLQFNGLPVQAGMIEQAITDADRSDKTNVTDVNGKIIRIGNIVFLTFNFKCSTWPEGSETRWILKIPDGFKCDQGYPPQTALSLVRNASQPADARAFIDQASMIQAKSGAGNSYIAGLWVTKDPWPSN